MKWFKHDADANMDAKLQEILLDYGLEGYGLYWYCLELIVNKVSADNITFSLEHDARVIARNTGSSVARVETIMRKFIELGLFEHTGDLVTCLKLAKRIDKSMTNSKQMRDFVEKLRGSDVMTMSRNVMTNEPNVMTTPDNVMTNTPNVMTTSANVMLEENRIEENRIEENIKHIVELKPDSVNEAAKVVINYLNLEAGKKFQHTPSHIKYINARIKEGRTVDELKSVIDRKVAEWGSNPNMVQYLRPQTLFGAEKFDGYLSDVGKPLQRSKPRELDHNDTSWGDMVGDLL